MARLSDELAAFRAEVAKDLAEVKDDLREHMKRTDLLERFQAKWSGAMMALTVLAAIGSLAVAAVKVFEVWR